MNKNLQRKRYSLRQSLMLSFLCLILVVLIALIAYLIFYNQQRKLVRFNQEMSGFHNAAMRNNQLFYNFITLGFNDPAFYTGLRKSNLEYYVDEINKSQKAAAGFQSIASNFNLSLNQEFSELKRIQAQLADSVVQMQKLYLKRGYEDYGTEGEMRSYAYLLQESRLIDELSLLKLRRHENDYLMRGETSSVSKFNILIDETLSKYRHDTAAILAVNAYNTLFNELVNYSTRLGVGNNSGLYRNVQNLLLAQEKSYMKITQKVSAQVLRIQTWFSRLILISVIVILLLLIVLSYFFTKYLTKDIQKLNLRMQEFITNRFKTDEKNPFSLGGRILEVDNLGKIFNEIENKLLITLEEKEKSYKDLEQASNYKSIFLANMTHEIRTPLNGVIGMIQVLISTDLNSEQKEHLKTIDYSARHLLELINMVLDFSKIEAGKMEIVLQPTNLSGEIKQLIKTFENDVRQKHLTLEFSISKDLKNYVLADIMRIKQVLYNLLANAIKFTESGSIRFHVNLLEEGSDFYRIHFSVSDDGIGIPAEKQQNLFKAFNQTDGSITRKYGGTGLGLAISRLLVNLMGGNITLHSEEGKGSTFSFELSFKKGQLIEKVSKQKPTEPRNLKIRVLVAEDNLINQQVILLMLRQYGMEFSIANNGREAVNLFLEKEFNLILMDLQMPDLDGYEALKMIRQSDKYRDSPIAVIAVTANAMTEDRKKAMEAGFDGFVAKPVNRKELDHAIAKGLAAYAAPEEKEINRP